MSNKWWQLVLNVFVFLLNLQFGEMIRVRHSSSKKSFLKMTTVIAVNDHPQAKRHWCAYQQMNRLQQETNVPPDWGHFRPTCPRAMGVRTRFEPTWRLEPGSTISGLHFGGAGPAVQTAGNWGAPGEDVRYFGGSTRPGHKINRSSELVACSL